MMYPPRCGFRCVDYGRSLDFTGTWRLERVHPRGEGRLEREKLALPSSPKKFSDFIRGSKPLILLGKKQKGGKAGKCGVIISPRFYTRLLSGWFSWGIYDLEECIAYCAVFYDGDIGACMGGDEFFEGLFGFLG